MEPGQVEFLGDGDGDGDGGGPAEPADESHDEVALGRPGGGVRWLVWAVVAALVLGGAGTWWHTRRHPSHTPSAVGSYAPTRPLPTAAYGSFPGPDDALVAAPIYGVGLAKARAAEACADSVVQELRIMTANYAQARAHGSSRRASEAKARAALRAVLAVSARPDSYAAVVRLWRVDRTALLAHQRRSVMITGVCD